jgi:Integrase zinc binding domain
MGGHTGRDETIKQTRRWFWWPGMNEWLADYVRGCATCQQAKIFTH